MRQHTKQELNQNKTAMIDAALKRAEAVGFANLTRNEVADACGISPALVSGRFGTFTEMKRDILRAAVKKESLGVIAYALAVGHPICKKISPELKARASAHLSSN